MEQGIKGGSECLQRSLILVSHENANSLHYTNTTEEAQTLNFQIGHFSHHAEIKTLTKYRYDL